MIPVLVADLPQMSQRRLQVVPKLEALTGWFRDQPVKRAEISASSAASACSSGPPSTDQMRTGPQI